MKQIEKKKSLLACKVMVIRKKSAEPRAGSCGFATLRLCSKQSLDNCCSANRPRLLTCSS